MNKELADLIFPNITKTIEDYENMYPERNLPDDAIVTRAAPSPTGYTHMGTLFQAFVSKKAAKDTNGVFFIRIEDTDRERLIEDATDVITSDLRYFNIVPDEGVLSNGNEIGNYGPYTQSNRKEIYQAFMKHLVLNGLAYPCFCTKEEKEEMTKAQEQRKDRIGYYGRYAKCR